MNKLELIESYIIRCDHEIVSKDRSKAERLQDEIIGVFESEIPHIMNMLDYPSVYINENYTIDVFGNLQLLKQKLINYAANIEQEQKKMEFELELARLKQPQINAHAEATPTQTTIVNITISIQQVLKQIDELSENSLSSTDKELLKNYILNLEGIKAARDKNKFWTKCKELLKFIADKGIDVAIATLPYIIQGLQTF